MSASLAGLRLQQPATIAEAVAAFAAHGDARYLAGGTDLLVNMRRGIAQPPHLIDLSRVAALKGARDDGEEFVIGAGVTVAEIAADATVAARYPALAQAAAAIAAPSHRAVATLGGNLCLDTRCVYYNQSEWWRRSNGYCLKHRGETCHVAPTGDRCHAAYQGDLAPALIACGASVEVAGARGARTIPLEDLYRDDGRAHLALEPGELVVAAVVPAQPHRARSAYRKARVRGAIDFPLAGVAVRLAMRDGRIAAIDVALTGTNSRPFRLAGSEAWIGRAVDDALAAELGKAVQKQVSPMRTTVTQSNWRRQVAAVEAQRLVRELAARG